MADVDVRFTLNGRAVRARVAPETALLELVRERFGLTGSKLGCGEGECGACAMLLDGQPVLGCLTPAVDVDGRTLITIEGLASQAEALQRAFVREGAIQCGFCTPGMLVAASAVLAEHPHADTEQIRRGLEGNLCRCTGYGGIARAVAAAGSGREYDAPERTVCTAKPGALAEGHEATAKPGALADDQSAVPEDTVSQ